MDSKIKNTPDTAISESAKANNHSINDTAEQNYKTFDDFINSDFYSPVYAALLEVDSAGYLVEELQTRYFEELTPGKDDVMIVYQFERYRALMWALSNAISNAYKELSGMGISRR